MKKENTRWSIKKVQEKIDQIEFPEFQREPTVWDLDKKRKLIDSILRNFDIATIYLYKREDGNYECIDGRQRINAIYSYIGLNDNKNTREGVDNEFKFVSSDELLGTNDLKRYDNKRFKDLSGEQQKKIYDYKMNVVEISDIDKAEELNLMFLRLQLGAHLGAGEKLNAMVGQMRDYIFKGIDGKKALGHHDFFNYLNIPKKRFSRELTSAQIAINFFSWQKDESFKKARFVDLQEFFKEKSSFTEEDKKNAVLLMKRLNDVMGQLNNTGKIELKNRAIGVSTFLFVNELIQNGQNGKIPEFIRFLRLFLTRLKEQMQKGIDMNPSYKELLGFQVFISQAAIEKYAIEGRQILLKKYFEYYLMNKKILGDS